MTPDQLNSFTFWYSVVSTVIGILLLIVSVGLGVKAWYDRKNKKEQVKIWMQDANGLQVALARIIQDNLDGRYSSTNDMANAIWSLQSMAFAQYQSLYEERCLDEKDFIKEQQALRRELNESTRRARRNQTSANRNRTSPSLPIPPNSSRSPSASLSPSPSPDS